MSLAGLDRWLTTEPDRPDRCEPIASCADCEEPIDPVDGSCRCPPAAERLAIANDHDEEEPEDDDIRF